jgi:hypothetical protein
MRNSFCPRSPFFSLFWANFVDPNDALKLMNALALMNAVGGQILFYNEPLF